MEDHLINILFFCGKQNGAQSWFLIHEARSSSGFSWPPGDPGQIFAVVSRLTFPGDFPRLSTTPGQVLTWNLKADPPAPAPAPAPRHPVSTPERAAAPAPRRSDATTKPRAPVPEPVMADATTKAVEEPQPLAETLKTMRLGEALVFLGVFRRFGCNLDTDREHLQEKHGKIWNTLKHWFFLKCCLEGFCWTTWHGNSPSLGSAEFWGKVIWRSWRARCNYLSGTQQVCHNSAEAFLLYTHIFIYIYIYNM